MNDWIRGTEAFDAVFDVARAVGDPEAPDYIHPALDSGDGMHLNDKGAQAMADAVRPARPSPSKGLTLSHLLAGPATPPRPSAA